MSIKLDWDIEDDKGWGSIDEDPEEIKRRKRSFRRIVGIGLAIIILIAGAAIFSVRRLNKLDAQLESNLRDTIVAETLSLRLSDKYGFIRAQANIELWQQEQSENFETYQAYGARLSITDEIIEMDINGNFARVVLLQSLDDVPYHVTWFYQHDDTGWHHIPSKPEYWGETLHKQTDYFNITYNEVDEETVKVWIAQLETEVEAICKIAACDCKTVGCNNSRWRLNRIPITFTLSDLEDTGWQSDGRLIMYSPQLGRVHIDGLTQELTDQRIQNLIGDRWLRVVTRRYYPAISDSPIRQDIETWYERETRHTEESTILLIAGEQSFGASFIPRILKAISQGEDPLEVTRSLFTERVGITPADDSLESRLAVQLQTESALRQQNGIYRSLANQLFVDPNYDFITKPVTNAPINSTIPESIQVRNLSTEGGFIEAEVVFRFTPGSGNPAGELVIVETFREVDGVFYRSMIDLYSRGGVDALTGDYGALIYHMSDSETATILHQSLAVAYPQILQDFDIESPGFEVHLFATTDDVSLIPIFFEPPFMVMPILAPTLTYYPAHKTRGEAVADIGTISLISHLLQNELQPQGGLNAVALGLLNNEAKRLGITDVSIYTRSTNTLNIHPTVSSSISLSVLWFPASANAVDSVYSYAVRVGGDVLIEILIERYGQEIIPALVESLGTSTSTDMWLINSTGIGSDDIVAEWRTRFELRLDELILEAEQFDD